MPTYKITKPLDPDNTPAGAPEWVVAACNRVKAKPAPGPTIEVDQEAAAKRAIDYLENHAPLAVEGAAGDHTTYQVAARVRDFGVDEFAANELIQTHWNDRCSPPWDANELLTKIYNAYAYGENAVGSSSPEADFDPIVPEQVKELFPDTPKRQPFIIKPAEFPNPKSIPARRWLLGHHLLIDKVSVTIAPPGAGKSTYSLGQGIAVVTGNKDITGLKVHETGNVLIINNEDDQDEMDRRLAAIIIHHQIPQEQLAGKLFSYSGVRRPFIMAKRRGQNTVAPFDRDALIEQVNSNNIRLVIVDPFLETHGVDENNNEEINKVARMYREVAVETHCAVQIIHHTRKLPSGSSDGHVGNMESGRGASSLSGVARIMNTLYSMSPKDATQYGIGSHERYLYVRLDNAKANLSLANHNALWYKKVSVELPNGDQVGVLEPVELTLAEDASRDAWLDVIRLTLIDSKDNELPVRRVAQAVLDDPMLGQGLGIETISNRVKKLLASRQVSNGWEIWYELDEQRPAGSNQTKHWIYGRVVADEQTPCITDSNA